jgi:hypothetical protein
VGAALRADMERELWIMVAAVQAGHTSSLALASSALIRGLPPADAPRLAEPSGFHKDGLSGGQPVGDC